MIIHFYYVLAFTMMVMIIVTIYFTGKTFTTLNDEFNMLKRMYLFIHISLKTQD